MKKVVYRKDIVSNKLYPTNEMIRLVRNNSGEVFIELDKHIYGRGAYIYPALDAMGKLKKYHLLEKALKVSIPECVYDELEKIIKEEVKSNE